MSTGVRVPDGFVAQRADAAWAQWIAALPRLAAEVLADWGLVADGAPMTGRCSLVLPVRAEPGATPAVLKLGFPDDPDAAMEHLALTRWAGDGAVELLRADPRRRTLLLERLGPEDLSQMWDVEACQLIGDRYARLHVPAGPQFERLSDRLRAWLPSLSALTAGAPVPRRMVEHAVALTKSFIGDEQTDGRLVHFDLHYANVLAGRREDWLVIDPKPLSGDPHCEPAPLLWNRWDELAGDVRGGIRRRFEATVDAGLLDEDRARAWVIVRMMLNVAWTVEDAARALGPAEKEWVTRCITVAKAVQ